MNLEPKKHTQCLLDALVSELVDLPTTFVCFREKFVLVGQKCQKVRCKACNEPVAAMAARLTSHLQYCPQRTQQMIGMMDSLPSVTKKSKSHNSTLTASIGTSIKSFADSLSEKQSEELNLMLAAAMHRTATPFSFFEHPLWKAFFAKLRPMWALPSPSVIGTSLLTSAYGDVMVSTFEQIRKTQSICMTLDGATNVMGKQVLNLMACCPKAWFLQHFTMELRRESADELLLKVIEAKNQVMQTLNPTSNEDGLREDQPNTSTSPLQDVMFSFCSDSPSVMVSLRRKIICLPDFTAVFGCSPHAINNFTLDILNKFPGPKETLKMCVFVVTKIRSTHLLSTLFDTLCKEKFGIILALLFFTKTRWTTSFYMFARILRVKMCLTSLPSHITMNDLNIDMPAELSSILLNTSFWKGCQGMHDLLQSICACTGYLEGDNSTFSAVYASFLYIKVHLYRLSEQTRSFLSLTDHDIENMVALLHKRFGTIYTPMHALAFRTDPFYHEFRIDVEAEYGVSFVEMDKGPLVVQCRSALQMFSGEHHSDVSAKLVVQFASFSVRRLDKHDLFITLKDMVPSLIWS